MMQRNSLKRRGFLIVALLMMALIFCSKSVPVLAQTVTLDQALTSLREDRKNEAMKLLQILANNGDGTAQFWLVTTAIMAGVNGAPNQSAIDYLYQMQPQLQLYADQNYDFAQFGLGLIYYLDGHNKVPRLGTAKSVAESSVNWLQKSANQQNEWAQYFLATAYREGFGVVANLGIALNWAKLSEAKGLKIAASLRQILNAELLAQTYAFHAKDAQEYYQRILRERSFGNGCIKYELKLEKDNFYYSYLTNCSKGALWVTWCSKVNLESGTVPDIICRPAGQGGQKFYLIANEKFRLATRPLMGAVSDWTDQNQVEVLSQASLAACQAPTRPQIANWEAKQARCVGSKISP